MGIIETIKNVVGSKGVPEEELRQAPLDESVEQKIETQEEQIQKLRQELQSKKQQESARTAMLEERLQEKEHEQKELREQLQQQQKQLSNVKNTQSSATTSTPPPDSKQMQDLPVISADGNKNFGKFKGWINEGDKIGIKCNHPKRGNKIEKVGWADNINDLVMDANQLAEKDVIIVKLNGRGQKVDYVNIHRYRETIQKKESLEDQKQRISMENDELIKQNRKLERLNQKLITQMSIDQMDSVSDNGNNDLLISRMANEREINKQRMDNLAVQNTHKRGRTEEIIEEYEGAMEGKIGELTKSESDMAIETTGDTFRNLLRQLGLSLDELDPETKEDLMSAIGEGGGGGAINIKEE